MSRIHRRGAIAGSSSGGPPPFIVTPIPTQFGTVGTAYSHTLTASGGTTPYSWSELNLPAGLSLASSTGVISGTPTTIETTEVSITCTDHLGNTAPASFSFQVTATIPSAPVLQSVVQNGPGTAFLTYTAATNAVGYGVNRNGVNLGSGNPNLTWEDPGPLTVGQTYSYTVYGVSSTGLDGPNSNAVGVTIVDEGLTLGSIPNQSGTEGTAIPGFTVTASGGLPPYHYSGVLPSGLVIASSTGAVSGTPTESGIIASSASVSDAASDVAGPSDFTFTVAASGAPVPVYPPPGGVGSLLFNSDFSTMGNASETAGPQWGVFNGPANNGVTGSPANVNIVGGQLVLTLSSTTVGAQVTTFPGVGTPDGFPAGEYNPGYAIPSNGGFYFSAGGYVEYSFVVPAGGWWAAWTVNNGIDGGSSTPQYAEFDITENLGSPVNITTNWHGPGSAQYGGGDWSSMPSAGQTVIAGGLLESGTANSYSSGTQKKSIANNAGGSGIVVGTTNMFLMLNIGINSGAAIPSYFKINYIRVWALP